MTKRLAGIDLQIAVDILQDAYENKHGWQRVINFLEQEGYEVNDIMQDDIMSEWEWQYGEDSD